MASLIVGWQSGFLQGLWLINCLHDYSSILWQGDEAGTLLALPPGMCPFSCPPLFHLAATQTQSLIFSSSTRWEYTDGCAGCCHPSLFNQLDPRLGKSLHFSGSGSLDLAFQPFSQ